MKKLLGLFALIAPLSAQAAETGALVRFVSCPVYRDTDNGRKSGCWLADDREGGPRYDVSLSPYKPDWNRAILVEGRIAAGGRDACGGAMLDPVRTSVLEEPCTRHMLPAEGYAGHRFVLPPRNIAPTSIARKVPEGPYGPRTFAIFFEFDRSFLVYQYGDYLLEQAATWLAAAKPKRIVVSGYAATRPETVSGRTLAERIDVAEERAETVAESLRRLLPGATIETRAVLDAAVADLPDADGIPAQSQRRVEIAAEF